MRTKDPNQKYKYLLNEELRNEIKKALNSRTPTKELMEKVTKRKMWDQASNRYGVWTNYLEDIVETKIKIREI